MISAMRPLRRSVQHMSVQVIEQETVIYDELHHQAWSLNPVSSCVWRLCDGQKTIEQICETASAELDAQVTAEIALLTLAELKEKNLLDVDTFRVVPDAVTRREMIGRAGLAAAALLPIIDSIFTVPAHAQSGSMTGMAAPAR